MSAEILYLLASSYVCQFPNVAVRPSNGSPRIKADLSQLMAFFDWYTQLSLVRLSGINYMS